MVLLSEKYMDPPNVQEIMEKMKHLPTMREMNDLVEEIFPDWVITFMVKYSSDYPTLTTNWKKICNISKTQQAQVMIVEEILSDDTHLLLNAFADCYTKAGFSVRRKREIIPCQKCNDIAVPSESMWKVYKEHYIPIPTVWSDKCAECRKLE